MCLVLENVVRLGGLSLQAEDCLIRAAVSQRGEAGGLVRMQNERYHQFLIWRSILPLYDSVVERDNNTDLIVTSNGTRHHFEMKNWRSPNGEREIPSIKRDIDRLRGRGCGYILITSANPRGQFNANIRFLQERLNALNEQGLKYYRFDTIDDQGNEIEYWLAGWPVLNG